jgi:hypothetical protein
MGDLLAEHRVSEGCAKVLTAQLSPEAFAAFKVCAAPRGGDAAPACRSCRVCVRAWWPTRAPQESELNDEFFAAAKAEVFDKAKLRALWRQLNG